MPGRIIPLVTEEIYHIYNRGTEKRDIYLQPSDFKRFVQTFSYYQFSQAKIKFSQFTKQKLSSILTLPDNKQVEIICFCLMPNHFHFLIRQTKEGGISIFMSQLSNSFTKYFNVKYKRVGALLQGTFKAELIQNDEQLIHTSRYIHINPIVSGLVKSLENYKWSSYQEYITNQSVICSIDKVLELFSSPADYIEFVQSQIEYGTSLEVLKHKAIDLVKSKNQHLRLHLSGVNQNNAHVSTEPIIKQTSDLIFLFSPLATFVFLVLVFYS